MHRIVSVHQVDTGLICIIRICAHSDAQDHGLSCARWLIATSIAVCGWLWSWTGGSVKHCADGIGGDVLFVECSFGSESMTNAFSAAAAEIAVDPHVKQPGIRLPQLEGKRLQL